MLHDCTIIYDVVKKHVRVERGPLKCLTTQYDDTGWRQVRRTRTGVLWKSIIYNIVCNDGN